jgi:hypothetical protein
MSAKYTFGERPLWQEHALLDLLCDPAVSHKKIPLAKGYFTPSTSLLLAALSYTPYQPEWKVTFDAEHPISLLVSLLQDLKTLSGACPARTASDSELADFLVSIKSRVSGMFQYLFPSLQPLYSLFFTINLDQQKAIIYREGWGEGERYIEEGCGQKVTIKDKMY